MANSTNLETGEVTNSAEVKVSVGTDNANIGVIGGLEQNNNGESAKIRYTRTS